MESKKTFIGKPKSEPTTEKVFTVVREPEPQRTGKVFTREVQEPEQTPRKVGGPTVEQLTGQGPALAAIRDFKPDKTARTHQNMLYQAMGEKFVTDHADEIPGAERLLKGRGCLEQLGRMINEGMEAATILEQAKIVGAAMIDGSTVKQVEEYLRAGRKHKGKWFNPAILSFPSNYELSGISNSDLVYITAFLQYLCESNEREHRNKDQVEWWKRQEHGEAHLLLLKLCDYAEREVLHDLEAEIRTRAKNEPRIKKQLESAIKENRKIHDYLKRG